MAAAAVEIRRPTAAISGLEDDVRTYVGTTVVPKCIFSTAASMVPADPAHVHVMVIDPAGGARRLVFGTDAAVRKLRTGVYDALVPCLSAGLWTVRWIGLGNGVDVVAESSFRVSPVRQSADGTTSPTADRYNLTGFIVGDRWEREFRWKDPAGVGIDLSVSPPEMRIALPSGTLALHSHAGTAKSSTGVWWGDQTIADERGRMVMVVTSATSTTIPAGTWPYELVLVAGPEQSTILRGTIAVTARPV